ncbi:MAG: TRAP transporter small permease [Burkholderiaceae bacterium]
MKILDHLEEWFIAFLMGAATLVIFFAVVHRYASGLAIPGLQDLLLQINTSWAQELTIYLFVWMAKFGAAYGVRTGIHVGVDVLLNRLPTPMQRRFILFGLLAGALFTGIIAALGAEFVIERSATSSTSEVMEVPIWVVYLAIPVGSALMCARFLQVAWQFLRGGELPSHDHSHVDGLEDDVAESKS